MFHETWIGKGHGFSVKRRMIRFAQQKCVQYFLRACKPKLVDATISLNQSQLRQIGQKPGLLPIFGNISVSASSELPPETKADFAARDKWILYFGSAPDENTITRIASELKSLAETSEASVGIAVVGRLGSNGEKFLSELKRCQDDFGLAVLHLGALREEQVSAVMTACTVGICRGDVRWLGKSGVAHAMAEHGLSLWVPQLPPDVPSRTTLEGKFNVFREATAAFDAPPSSGTAFGAADVAQLYCKRFLEHSK